MVSKKGKKAEKSKESLKTRLKNIHKKEDKAKKEEFPSNFRFITERWFLTALLTVLIVIPSLIVAFDLGQNLKKREEAVEKKEKLVKELIYWQNVVNTHKGYRDGYFKIALLEFQLNDKEKARVYLEKVLRIDPNFEPGLKLQEVLNSNIKITNPK